MTFFVTLEYCSANFEKHMEISKFLPIRKLNTYCPKFGLKLKFWTEFWTKSVILD